jgi:hypothetical protein
MTSSAALVGAAVRLASAKGATISTFLKGLSAVESAGTDRPVTLAKKIDVTEAQKETLATLGDALAELSFPDVRRELSPAEEKELAAVLDQVKVAAAVVKDATDNVRIALFNHLDAKAEREGKVSADTPVDAKGFYLVAGEGPGYKRQVSSGTPAADVEELAALEAEGLITHREYLKMTKTVRVVDDGGFLAFVAKNPERLSALRRAVKMVRAASVSLKTS